MPEKLKVIALKREVHISYRLKQLDIPSAGDRIKRDYSGAARR
jgi:hypothetical protein